LIKDILEDYKNNVPVDEILERHGIHCRADLVPIIRGAGLDPAEVYRIDLTKLKSKEEVKKKKEKISRDLHKKLIYEVIDELWDINKTFITIDDNPRPDVIVIDWESRQITAVEVETGGEGKKKTKVYDSQKNLKPFNTLLIKTAKNIRKIEYDVGKQINPKDNTYMSCLNCGHTWLPRVENWKETNQSKRKYLQCSMCGTLNYIPENVIELYK